MAASRIAPMSIGVSVLDLLASIRTTGATSKAMEHFKSPMKAKVDAGYAKVDVGGQAMGEVNAV